MRAARAADHWRHVSEGKRWRRGILAAAFPGLQGMCPAQVTLSPGVTVICGHNGSGKTTLLRAMQGALEPSWLQSQSALRAKLAPGRCEISILEFSRQIQRSVAFNSVNHAFVDLPDTSYIEVASWSTKVQSTLQQTVDLADILETVEFRNFREEELAAISYAVGKDYSEATVAELDEWEDLGVTPYFKVKANGVDYNSETMGLGELSAFLVYWLLSGMPPDSLLLLEEPESFLSPRSQLAVADLIAKFSDERRLSVIISTHSPYIVSRVPHENIRVLVSDGTNIQSFVPSDNSMPMALLGMHIPPPVGIIFVEDICAQYLLEAIIEAHQPSLFKCLSLVRRGSWTDILASLSALPTAGHPFAFCGVLDGDQRNAGHSSAWPLLFLPSLLDPDSLVVECAYANRTGFLASLDRNNLLGLGAMESLAGFERHDWAIEFGRQVGHRAEAVYAALCKFWIASAQEIAAREALVNQIGGIARLR